MDEASVSYVRTALRIVHFIGLVLGMGGAVFVEMLLHRSRRRILSVEFFETIVFTSRFVGLGLVLLWLSGLGFLALYFLAEPAKLANPKILAKMTIVGLLTVNGVFVHRFVIPFLKSRIGQPLLDGIASRTVNILAACAAVSVASWTVPMVLGAAPQLNFVVRYELILAGHALLMFFAFLGIKVVIADGKRPFHEKDIGDARSVSDLTAD